MGFVSFRVNERGNRADLRSVTKLEIPHGYNTVLITTHGRTVVTFLRIFLSTSFVAQERPGLYLPVLGVYGT